MNENDKVSNMIAGHAMRFVRNDGDGREGLCLIEVSDSSADEIELAYTLHRDRYYLRMRKADLARLLKETP